MILLYHGVRPRGDTTSVDVPAKHVPEAIFRRQIEAVGRRYEVVSMTEAVKRISSDAPLARDLACMTFDDGYENNATVAAPVLRAAGILATFFVTTDIIENRKTSWMDRLEAAIRRLPNRRLEVIVGSEGIELRLSDARARAISDARLRVRLRTVPASDHEAVIRREDVGGGEAPVDGLRRGMSWEQVRSHVDSSQR